MDPLSENAFHYFLDGLCVAAVVVVVLMLRERGRRAEKLARIAYDLGYDFSVTRVLGDIEEEYTDFECMIRGEGQYVTNSISGNLEGFELQMFDYKFTYATSRDRLRVVTCIAVDTGYDLKSILIRPERLGDKIAASFGLEDIDFSRFPEFSKKNFVKADSRLFAHDLLTPLMMNYLVKNKGWQIQIIGSKIMICPGRSSTQELMPKDVVTAIEFMRGFLKLIPDAMRHKKEADVQPEEGVKLRQAPD